MPENRKKLSIMRVMVISVMIGGLRKVPKGLEKRTGGTENQRKNQNHSECSIIKIA